MAALDTLSTMFSNVFANKPAAVTPAVAANTPGTPGNIPATGPNVQTVAGNPTAPVTPVPSTDPATTPMAKFDKLWETDPNKKPAANAPLFTIDPKKIAEAASAMDFRGAITPELATRMKAGGDDGFSAMTEVMNTMTQAVFAKATEAAAAIAQEGIKKAEVSFNAKIPGMLRNQNLKNSLQENPALSNPAAAPMVAAVTKQLQVKHPQASESELRALTSDYFDNFAKMVVAQSASNDPANKAKDVDPSTDFSNW